MLFLTSVNETVFSHPVFLSHKTRGFSPTPVACGHTAWCFCPYRVPHSGCLPPPHPVEGAYIASRLRRCKEILGEESKGSFGMHVQQQDCWAAQMKPDSGTRCPRAAASVSIPSAGMSARLLLTRGPIQLSASPSKRCEVLSGFNGIFLITNKCEDFFICLLISLLSTFRELSTFGLCPSGWRPSAADLEESSSVWAPQASPPTLSSSIVSSVKQKFSLFFSFVQFCGRETFNMAPSGCKMRPPPPGEWAALNNLLPTTGTCRDDEMPPTPGHRGREVLFARRLC